MSTTPEWYGRQTETEEPAGCGSAAIGAIVGVVLGLLGLIGSSLWGWSTSVVWTVAGLAGGGAWAYTHKPIKSYKMTCQHCGVETDASLRICRNCHRVKPLESAIVKRKK